MNYIRGIITYLFFMLALTGVSFGQVDYTSVSTGIIAEISPILALGLAIAVAAVGLMAAPKGIRFAKRCWAAIAGS